MQSERITAGVFFAWLVLMWVRTGAIPAASGSGDVWFTEAAYWLVRDGVLRSDWHRDAIGSHIHDFLPPVLASLQAVAFRIFGISAFSASLVPPVLLTVIVLLTGFLFSRQGGPPLSLLALAPFAFPGVYRAAIATRFEICIAFFLTLALTALWHAKRSGFKSRVLLLLFGMALGFSAISYYQVAVLLLLFGAAVIVMVGAPLGRLQSALYFCGGAAIPLLTFGVWIYPDFHAFAHALAVMAGKYTYTPLITPEWIAVAGCFVAIGRFAATGGRRSLGTDGTRIVAALCVLAGAVLTLQVINFPHLSLVSSQLALFAILFVVGAQRSSGIGQSILAAKWWRAAGATGVLGALMVASATAYVGLSSKARSYGEFAEALRRTVNREGVVVADGRAWIALRESLPAGQFIHLIGPSTDPALAHVSLLLNSADSASISALIVDPELVEFARRTYPAVNDFLQQPNVEGPLSIGIDQPYRLDVYRRRPGDSITRGSIGAIETCAEGVMPS